VQAVPRVDEVLERASPVRAVWLRRLLRNPTGLISAAVLVLLALAAILAPVVTPYGPNTPDLTALLQPPGGRHLLGTNDIGIDLLSEILYGMRLSLVIGLVSAVIAGVVGAIFGAVAGYFGGAVDMVIMRLVDVALSVPLLFVLLVLIVILGSSVATVVAVIGLSSWMYPARIVRSQFLVHKELPYVSAARAIGGSDIRIMFRHILPNVASALLVNVTLLVGQAILLESAMSFLGAGLEPPNITLGYLLNQAQSYLQSAPWLMLFPGLALFAIVECVNLLGDALTDALDTGQSG
jgi:peptide/nickel transport system permease protein